MTEDLTRVATKAEDRTSNCMELLAAVASVMTPSVLTLRLPRFRMQASPAGLEAEPHRS